MGKEQELLKPCPLCNAAMVLAETGRWVHPWNDDCPLDSVTIHVKNEPHIAAWNRRSSDEQAEVVGWRDLLTEAREWVELAPDLPGLDPPDEQLVRDLLKRIDAYLLASPPSVAKGGVTEALTWYGERASSLASRFGQQSLQTMNDADTRYIEAILVELSLDAGRRAAAALPTPPSRGEGE